MATVQLSNYPTLAGYEILAATGITTVNTTTVNNGKYGTPGGVGITGTFVATGTPSGADNTSNATTARTELTALVNDLATYVTAPGRTQTTIGTVSGSVTYSPNINYNSATAILFDSTAAVTFDAGGDVNAQFFITAGTSITFQGATPPTFTLANGASAGNVFFRAGSAIVVTVVGGALQGNLIAGTSITSAVGEIFNGRLYAQTGNVTFSGTTTANAIGAVTPVVCYAEGTKILTPSGYVAVEDLKEGDDVVTKGTIRGSHYPIHDASTVEKVTWTGNFTVNGLDDATRPIRIQKDALGAGMPFQDLYVSPDHRLLLDGTIVRAKRLVNGTSIVQEFARNDVTYHHFEVKHHTGVIANGVLAETYAGDTPAVFGKVFTPAKTLKHPSPKKSVLLNLTK